MEGFIMWAQKDNFSSQNLSNNVTNQTLFDPNELSTTPQHQTQNLEGPLLDKVNMNNSISSCDLQSYESAEGFEHTTKGSSSGYWIKGQWTVEEDRKLVKLVNEYGVRKWAVIAEHMAGRVGKQCRERWQNHLRPDIKKSLVWTDEEEKLIIEGHEKFGNRWAEIAKYVPGRSENSIKNHWNATKRKQTSKRKIRRPERLRGLIQSTVLEEYIKNKYFNKANNNHPITTTTTINNPLLHNNISTFSDNDVNDSTSYFTLETFDEEMDFMKNLFASGDKSNQVINASNNSGNQVIDVVQPRDDVNVGNNLLASSSSGHDNVVQFGGNNRDDDVPIEEVQEAYFPPEIYLYSYLLSGSFSNMG